MTLPARLQRAPLLSFFLLMFAGSFGPSSAVIEVSASGRTLKSCPTYKLPR